MGDDEENNEESEETPNTTRQAILRLDSPQHPLLKAEWTEVDGGRREKKKWGEGKGQWREQGRFCSFSRDLARTEWRESVMCGTWHEMTKNDEK